MQYGGGERDPTRSASLLKAFFNPSSYDRHDRRKPTAIRQPGRRARRSRFMFQGSVPFAVYFEYAGEDTSTNSNFRLGNAALSAGPRFPSDRAESRAEVRGQRMAERVVRARNLSGRFEERAITSSAIGAGTGAWSATAVGARSWMVQVAWEPRFGGLIEATYRSLENQLYSNEPYVPGSDLNLRYSHQWRQFLAGAEVSLRPRRVRRDLFACQRLPALLGPRMK